MNYKHIYTLLHYNMDNTNILYDQIYDMLPIIFTTLFVIGVLDYVFCAYILKLSRGSGGGERWFMLHAIINFWIMWTSLPDLYTVVFDPIKTIMVSSTISSLYPFSASISLHIYHSIVFFKDLTHADWLHHILMIFVGAPLIFFQIPSPTINALHVFLTGLPGGIDYLMLVAVKKKYMKPITEKFINRCNNLMMRMPGSLYITSIIYARGLYMLYNSPNGIYTKSQFSLLMVNILLSSWNAIYFMEQVVASYHKSNNKIVAAMNKKMKRRKQRKQHKKLLT